VSNDGATIGGAAYVRTENGQIGIDKAMLWRGDDYSVLVDMHPTKEILDKLELTKENINSWGFSDQIGSEIVAMDGLSKVFGGNLFFSRESTTGNLNREVIPVAWLADSKEKIIVLPAASDFENFNGKAFGEVFTLSRDGKVIGGDSYDKEGLLKATIWSGEKFNTATVLDHGGFKSGVVAFLNEKGDIAIGEVSNKNFADEDYVENTRTVVWKIKTTNEDESKEKTESKVTVPPSDDLENTAEAGETTSSSEGTNNLSTDNTPSVDNNSSSIDNNLSVDNSNENANINNSANTDNGKNTVNDGSRESITSVMVDIERTKQSMAQIGSDAILIANTQRIGLERMLNHCHINGTGLCYSLTTDFYSASKEKRDRSFAGSIGVGVNDYVGFGLTVDHSLKRDLPKTHKRIKTNDGVGFHLQFNYPVENGHYFLDSSIAFNNYKMEVKRAEQANTEVGTGKVKMHGYAWKSMLGRTMNYNGYDLMLSTGIQHIKLTRNSYTETNVEFPITYDELNYKDTSWVTEFNGKKDFTPHIFGFSGAKFEYLLSRKETTFNAKADYIGNVSLTQDKRKASGEISIGLGYRILPEIEQAPSLAITISPYVARDHYGKTRFGGRIGLSGRF
ncbi:autotransporter domain-containing protein, partial [Otariodibacter sp.]|uniref:autotransporter outer membrane beta-barrel domain-containing protein n=1 Tax=Otariodibacter sp. TaxID=3030919 RepID=UPI00261B07C7